MVMNTCVRVLHYKACWAYGFDVGLQRLRLLWDNACVPKGSGCGDGRSSTVCQNNLLFDGNFLCRLCIQACADWCCQSCALTLSTGVVRAVH